MNDTQQWILRSRELLDASARQLDGTTLSRLNRARHAALDALEGDERRPQWLRWVGATAVTAGLALVLWRGLVLAPEPIRTVAPLAGGDQPRTIEPVAAAVAAPDFELLADPESYALLEDLEFYAWLDAAKDRGG